MPVRAVAGLPGTHSIRVADAGITGLSIMFIADVPGSRSAMMSPPTEWMSRGPTCVRYSAAPGGVNTTYAPRWVGAEARNWGHLCSIGRLTVFQLHSALADQARKMQRCRIGTAEETISGNRLFLRQTRTQRITQVDCRINPRCAVRAMTRRDCYAKPSSSCWSSFKHLIKNAFTRRWR